MEIIWVTFLSYPCNWCDPGMAFCSVSFHVLCRFEALNIDIPFYLVQILNVQKVTVPARES